MMQLTQLQPIRRFDLMASQRRKQFSDQLRAAVDASGHSRLAVGRGAEIDKATISRFMAGQAGLSMRAIDRLVRFLELELGPKGGKKGRAR